MLELTESPISLIFRSILLYVGLFLIFRLIGRKQLGELSPFDFILLLIVGEAAGNTITGEDTSIVAGLIAVVTLISLSSLVDTVLFKSRKLEILIEGEPLILIENGELNAKVLKRLKITTSEIEECLREREIEDIKEVKKAILEKNGRVTVLKKHS